MIRNLKRRVSLSSVLIAALILLASGCSQQSVVGPDRGTEQSLDDILAQLPDESSQTPPAPAYGVSSEVAIKWYELTDKIIRTEKLTPPVASRLLGYMGLALYEAVEPGSHNLRPLAGQVNDLKPSPFLGSLLSHWPTVANVTLAATIKGILPTASAASVKSIDSLKKEIEGTYSGKVGRLFTLFGTARGLLVSHHILEYAAADGFSIYNNCSYTPPVGPGLWVPTPPAFAPALQPCWGELRPFVIAQSNVCEPIAHNPFSTDSSSEFYREAKEVYTIGKNLTVEQTTIARYWADGGGTATPPGHSVAILTQLLKSRNATLYQAAEAYAKVGMAAADAFIACWWTKYEYNLLRPVTYVHQNIDSTWLPLIATPPFPEYTSGHSVQSGAMSQVMTDLFGTVAFTDYTQVAYGQTARSFASFYAAADEAAVSRLYGGIHYRQACELGVEQGRCIGEKVSALKTRRGNHHVEKPIEVVTEMTE